MLKAFHIALFTLISTFAISQTVVDIIVNSPAHNTLETAVVAAGLADPLSNASSVTVFAPTDDAFDNLPDGVVAELLQNPTGDLARILLYHVVNGEARSTDLSDGQVVRTALGQEVTVSIDNNNDVTINDAFVSLKDIPATNGVVHVLDAVLLPPSASIYDVVANSSVHTTLKAAIDAAELDDVLGDPDLRFTLFAPTNAAFAALPMGVLDELLMDPEGDLTRILAHHVLGGEASSDNLSNGLSVPTVLGQNIEVTINNDGIFINDAEVIIEDIITFNGIVHVVDAVILPALTVAEVIVNSPDHTILEQAVGAAQLQMALEGDGPFTVFAPTDEAFENLPMGTLDALLQDPTGDLAKILLYHVVGEEFFEEDLSDGQDLSTLFGPDVNVSITNDGVFINDVEVTVTDIVTLNGIVHVVDAVILPVNNVYDVVAASSVHTTLKAAIDAAELDEALQDGDAEYTLFAPTDEAFNNLPDGTVAELLQDPTGNLARILLYHALGNEAFEADLSDGLSVTTLLGQNVDFRLDSDGAFINGAKISITDIRTLNGVVHVIDAVILPPAETIVDVVVNSEVHTILEQAVGAAQLVETLSGAGPFTLFAPTDEAFGKLPAGTLDALLVDPTGDLAKILQYHALSGEVLSTDLSNDQVAETVLGQDITVTINNDGVFINDAKVVITDIRTYNGVVHVIEDVLLPDLNTAVRGLEEVKIAVTPNPASDFIQVEVSDEMLQEGVIAQLIDVRGAILENRQVQDRVAQIEVSQYPAGTYFLLLRTESSYAKSTIVIK